MTQPEVLNLSAPQWKDWLSSLYERDDRLEVRLAGEHYPRSEAVDTYTLSAHAEALLSEEVDGDVWGTLEDIDETAGNEEEAWDKICAFYAQRGCVRVCISGLPEREEWILVGPLARRLRLV